MDAHRVGDADRRAAVPAAAEPMCPIVEFMAGQAGLPERLLADHVDDGAGRCRVCSGGGQTGRLSWPCRLHDYASRADYVSRARELARRRDPRGQP